MCVGHPKRHPCQHTSVNYNHCVAAHFDRHTRLTTPCHNTTYAAPVDSDSKCSNQLCYFEEVGGSWICCQCNNGPNNVGWCTFHRPRVEVNALTGRPEQLTTCDHCCCWNCTSYREFLHTIFFHLGKIHAYISALLQQGVNKEDQVTVVVVVDRRSIGNITVLQDGEVHLVTADHLAKEVPQVINGLKWITVRKVAHLLTKSGKTRRSKVDGSGGRCFVIGAGGGFFPQLSTM